MQKIIWMSDLHFQSEGKILGHDPRARLAAAVDYVNLHHSDAAFCVISGDLVDHGTAEGYAALRVYLDRLAMPYLPLTGNHDDRALLAAALPLPMDCQDGFVQYAVDLPGATLICLDTLKPGDGAGDLCAGRLEWLADALAARPGVPAYIFMHHPPVDLGLPRLDPMRLLQAERFLDVVETAGTVRQIFAGHVHRPCTALARGIPVTTMRSVLLQAPPPWPDWEWDGFIPAREAPAIGILGIDGADCWLQSVEFCDAGCGVDAL